jgi:hypothetical protein
MTNQSATGVTPNMNHMYSDGIYSSIRNSNPFTKAGATFFGSRCEVGKHASWESEGSFLEQKSAVTKPLFDQKSSARKPHCDSLEGSSFVRTINEAKAPTANYESNDYKRDVKPFFMERNMQASVEHQAYHEALPKQSYRFPEPVHQINEKGITYHIPQTLPWPGQSPQCQPPNKTAPPSGSDGERTPNPPPVPAKNPQRYNSVRSLASTESSRQNSLQSPLYPTLGPRIISVENIRAYLTVSLQASHEDMKKVDEQKGNKVQPPQLLRTYNSHMFPRQQRKGTPLSGSNSAWYDDGGDYKLGELNQDETK